jgi:hypothetical protein
MESTGEASEVSERVGRKIARPPLQVLAQVGEFLLWN